MFNRPHPTCMQYMSLDPISLALADKQMSSGKDVSFSEIDAEEELEKACSKKLVEKLKWHTVVLHIPSQKEVMLPIILNQVNCAFEIGQIIEKNSRLIGTRPKREV